MANTNPISIKARVLIQDLDEQYKAQLLKVEPKDAKLYAEPYRSNKALILLSTGDLIPPKCRDCHSRGYRLMSSVTTGKRKPEDFKQVACHCLIKQVSPPDMDKLYKKAKLEQDEKDRANSRGVAENPPPPSGDGKGITKAPLKARKKKVTPPVSDGREKENSPSNEAVPKPRKKRAPAKSKAKVSDNPGEPGNIH